jgi:Xaa-Pro aminopeptidase
LLKQLDKIAPNKIALNYSVDAVMADGLSYGMWLTLNDLLKGTAYIDMFESSEKIISALRGRKTNEELQRISESCDTTQEILHSVTGFLKPGVTEQQVAAYILDQVKERGLELAWDPDHCPAVFTGPESAGAHAGPTDRPVERGHIMNIDFGVKKNGYCSDLQRTWYILREGEDTAPDNVIHGFNTIVEAIRKAADAIEPGKLGHEIDDAARGHIVDAGYEEYPHALGHQVGRVAHDGGGLLGPLWDRYGNIVKLPIEVGNVFTLEPRLTVEGHGIATVEEEIVVTSGGCRFLSKPQEEIYLVR